MTWSCSLVLALGRSSGVHEVLPERVIGVEGGLRDGGLVRLQRDAALMLLAAERGRRIFVGVLAIEVRDGRGEAEAEVHHLREVRGGEVVRCALRAACSLEGGLSR